MDFSFYIVSIELFRVYKLFSISCRCSIHFATPEEARKYAYNFCDGLKPVTDNISIETANENRIIVHTDDGNEKNVLNTIITINQCESISNNGTAFMYRNHMIEMTDKGWIISLEDGPVMGLETLDACLDFIDYTMVTRDNVIRIRGEHMMTTPAFNKGKPIS